MQCKTCCNVIPCRSPYSLNVEAKNGTSASDIAMTRHATNLIELLETGQDNGDTVRILGAFVGSTVYKLLPIGTINRPGHTRRRGRTGASEALHMVE